MPRQVNITLESLSLGCSLKKFTRDDVYGKKKQIRRDPDGVPLETVYITPDGLNMIQSTKGHYVNEKGEFVPKGEVNEVSVEGKPLPWTTSMFKSGIFLEQRIPVNDLFLVDVESSYILQTEATDYIGFYQVLEAQLRKGFLFRFDYAYNFTAHPKTGVFLPKEGKIIVLIGQSSEPEFLSQEQLELLDEIQEDEGTEFEAW